MLVWLIAAASMTAVDAERAFARDAKRIGQWTAFRKYADETAVMFNPQAVWAHEFLAPLKDPPKALSWGPSESWVSCDGRAAINRGPWTSPAGSKGYFTTVWFREDKGWQWTYDGSDTLAPPIALPRKPRIDRASCAGRSKLPQEYREEVKPTARIAGKPPADAGQGRIRRRHAHLRVESGCFGRAPFQGQALERTRLPHDPRSEDQCSPTMIDIGAHRWVVKADIPRAAGHVGPQN